MKLLAMLTASVVLSVSALADTTSKTSVCDFGMYMTNSVGARARIAAEKWVEYQDNINQINQRIKKISQIENDDDRELAGRSVLLELQSLESHYQLASCVDREISLREGQKKEFPGVNFIVSDKNDSVPFIITQEMGANKVSIKTANLDYAYDLETKQLLLYSSEKGKHIAVDYRTDRWISHIIQKHNL